MTDKELKRLGRADLVEMLLSLTQENEQLREELEQAQALLEKRTIAIENTGSLAEAALQLNSVFEVAQAACEQYSENVQLRYSEQRAICDQMEQETIEKCKRLQERTKKEVEEYWAYARQKVQEMYYQAEQKLIQSKQG